MKFAKKFLALALCLVLCLGLCATAFAEDTYNVSTTVRTAAESGIVKTLNIAEGTTLPAVDYTFSVAPGTPDTTNVFAVAADKAFTATIASTAMTHNLNMYTGSISIATMFSSLTERGITHAGVWIFNVKETTEAIDETVTEGDVKTTRKLTVDASEYILRLYVTNTSTGGIEISNVTVEKGGNKVDPKIVETTTTGEGATGSSANASGFQFKNTYKETVEKPGPGPGPFPTPTETGAYTVKKTIVPKETDGSIAYANTSRMFPVKVMLTRPSTMENTDELYNGVSYKIYRAATAEYPDGQVTAEATLAYGSTDPIQLSHGDVLVIEKIAVGTEFKIEETGYTDWVDGYKTGEYTAKSGTFATTDKENGVHSNVNNLFDDQGTTPTGIVVNNLPFVLIVLLAVSGIAVYFVVRRRREQED